jgi:hypothetical protein
MSDLEFARVDRADANGMVREHVTDPSAPGKTLCGHRHGPLAPPTGARTCAACARILTARTKPKDPKP